MNVSTYFSMPYLGKRKHNQNVHSLLKFSFWHDNVNHFPNFYNYMNWKILWKYLTTPEQKMHSFWSSFSFFPDNFYPFSKPYVILTSPAIGCNYQKLIHIQIQVNCCNHHPGSPNQFISVTVFTLWWTFCQYFFTQWLP